MYMNFSGKTVLRGRIRKLAARGNGQTAGGHPVLIWCGAPLT